MHPDPQFADVSDLELLHTVCTSAPMTSYPYKEFVRRFLPEVKEKCKEKCNRQKLDPHIGESIAHDVFARLRRYKTFKKDKFQGTGEHKWILAYLIRAAGNLFIDHFYQTKRAEEAHVTYFDDFREEASSIDPSQLKDVKEKSELIFKEIKSERTGRFARRSGTQKTWPVLAR